ncbi:hypothetical protein PSPO01_15373 [Paraphaeosphaeria sporulosa]
MNATDIKKDVLEKMEWARAQKGQLSTVPRLTAKELATVAKREVLKTMEWARRSDIVDKAKQWESMAQTAARKGRLSTVPGLTAKELATVAKREVLKTKEALTLTNAHFSTVLRDRAQSDDWRFVQLQKIVFWETVPTIVIAIGLFISGSMVSLRPRNWYFYVAPSIIFDIVVIALGFSVSYHVSGFRTSFEVFGGSDHIPYYDLMHLGGIGQASFGIFHFIGAIVYFFMESS